MAGADSALYRGRGCFRVGDYLNGKLMGVKEGSMPRIRNLAVLSLTVIALGMAGTAAVAAEEQLPCELAIAATQYDHYVNGQWVGYWCYGNPNNCCRF